MAMEAQLKVRCWKTLTGIAVDKFGNIYFADTGI